MITVFEATYDGESIIDLPEAIGNMLDIDYNSIASTIPQDEWGLHTGTFHVKITWVPDKDEE
jgi:hypothetical protein